jgi:hypothetical protein
MTKAYPLMILRTDESVLPVVGIRGSRAEGEAISALIADADVARCANAGTSLLPV